MNLIHIYIVNQGEDISLIEAIRREMQSSQLTNRHTFPEDSKLFRRVHGKKRVRPNPLPTLPAITRDSNEHLIVTR